MVHAVRLLTPLLALVNRIPVHSVGAFMNYAPDPRYGPTYIDALDSSGNILESYELNSSAPISTPYGVDAGASRGITRSTADIRGCMPGMRLSCWTT